MLAEPPDNNYIVWAITHTGDEVRERYRNEHLPHVEQQATWIARQGFPDGAVSVWIESPDGEVVWAAGQKAWTPVSPGTEELEERVYEELVDLLASATGHDLEVIARRWTKNITRYFDGYRAVDGVTVCSDCQKAR